MSEVEVVIDMPAEYSSMVFGQFDEYAKAIESNLNIELIARDGVVKIIGAEANVIRARGVLDNLIELARRGNQISRQSVDYAISLSFDDKQDTMLEIDSDTVCRTIAGKPIKPKTLGPAGTGKTYLAMAMAIQAFKSNEVNKIILTRPAIEAGEKLGFLPGDLQSKVDPYLRPLYDALFQIMGAESFNANMEKGLIEVAPLAYMRGRTLDNAFIILDEAQNTTPAQMKMFLTRIGFGSKVVVTGDQTQKDLPRDVTSGLDVAMKVLSKVDELGFVKLTNHDVVRHPLVQKIVKAKEEYKNRQNKKEFDRRNRKESKGRSKKNYDSRQGKKEKGTRKNDN